MKKNVIALAVAAAAVATGANAATVYDNDGTELKVGGRAEFRGDFIGTGGSEIDGTMANKSRFRLNLGGSTEISNNLSAFGFYEAEQGVYSSNDNSIGEADDDDDGDNPFTQRYLFAGLKGDFGAVSFGRQDTAAVIISQMSDVTTFTGAQKEFTNFGNEQVNNTILYAGQFDALEVKASLVLGEADDEDGYGVAAIYTLPMGLALGLGYSGGDNGPDVSPEAFIGGISYTLDGLYVAATYTTGDDSASEAEFDGMEFAASYNFGNGFTLLGAYQKTEVDDVDQSDFFEVTGDYAFTSNVNAYLAYLYNNIDNKAADEDTLRFGMKYTF
ncbi:porin [Vibrio sp. WXL103]|uniref:porin n=1 Tax=unclassified Vibrio TaxID=2614977 RepID=UPI003EC777C6